MARRGLKLKVTGQGQDTVDPRSRTVFWCLTSFLKIFSILHLCITMCARRVIPDSLIGETGIVGSWCCNGLSESCWFCRALKEDGRRPAVDDQRSIQLLRCAVSSSLHRGRHHGQYPSLRLRPFQGAHHLSVRMCRSAHCLCQPHGDPLPRLHPSGALPPHG